MLALSRTGAALEAAATVGALLVLTGAVTPVVADWPRGRMTSCLSAHSANLWKCSMEAPCCAPETTSITMSSSGMTAPTSRPMFLTARSSVFLSWSVAFLLNLPTRIGLANVQNRYTVVR